MFVWRRFGGVLSKSSCGLSTSAGGGFSFPGVRSLKELTNLEMLAEEPVDKVTSIWEKYPIEMKKQDECLHHVLPKSKYKILKDRASTSPFFIFPVFRQSGFFNVLCQFQDKVFLITSLEQFKEDPSKASPLLVLSLYDDFLRTKEIALARTDITNTLNASVGYVCVTCMPSRPESSELFESIVEFYTNDAYFNDFVDAFNNRPKEFNFDEYLAKYKGSRNIE